MNKARKQAEEIAANMKLEIYSINGDSFGLDDVWVAEATDLGVTSYSPYKDVVKSRLVEDLVDIIEADSNLRRALSK